MAKPSSTFIFKFALWFAVLCTLKFAFGHLLQPQQRGLSGLFHHLPVEVLVVGTSHVDSGWDAKEASGVLGKKVYTLWFPGLSFEEMELVVDRVLEAPPGQIKNLILDVFPSMLTVAPNAWGDEVYAQLPPSGKVRLLRLYSTYPSLSTSDLVNLVVAKGTAVLITQPFANLVDTYWTMGTRLRTKPAILPVSWQHLKISKRFTANGFKPLESQLAAFRRIVSKLADRPDLHVTYEETPLPEVALASPQIALLRQLAKRTVEELGQGAIYVDGNSWPEFSHRDSSLYADDHHLSQQGRKLFTQLMTATLLRQGLLR